MAVLLLCFVIFLSFYPTFGFIFDSPNSVDSNAIFKKNECFKTSSDMTSWLERATSGSKYKRYVRPGFNESLDFNPPLLVNISIDMNSMASVDEINSEYKIILKMDLEWMDERLINNCSKVPIPMPLDEYHLYRIWSPALGVLNIKDPETSIIQGSTLVLGQLRTDGYIHIRHSLLLSLFCYLDFAMFPFDKQECFIKLESKSFPRSDVILAWRNDHPFRNLDSFLMTGFTLIGYKLYNDSTMDSVDVFEDIYGMDMMSQIMVKLIIRREWNNYFLEIYVPSILFVMISWLSFWMQITSAPARVSLGMTTMLTLVTSSQSTRDKLPRIAYVHALDVWIAICTCLIFLSLLEFALVSYIHRYSLENKAKEKERLKKEKEKLEKLKAKQRNSQYFPVLGMRKGSVMRHNSDTTEYINTEPTQPQFVHLVNSNLDQIQLAVPLAGMTPNYKRSKPIDEDPFALELRYPSSDNDEGEDRSKQKKQQQEPTRLFCCVFWCKTGCQGDKLASAIDRKCRFIFPLAFIVFNVAYWWIYTQMDRDIAVDIAD